MAYDFSSLWAEWGFVYLIILVIGTAIIITDEKILVGSGPFNILALFSGSLLVRTVWAFCNVDYSASLYWMRLLDRLSILFQLSAISVLVLGWGQAVNVDHVVRERTRLGFIIINVLLYIFTFSTGFSDEGSTVFYVNIIILAGATLLVTLSVQVYGFLILRRLNASNNSLDIDERIVKAFRKIAIVSTILTLCFIARFAAYIDFVESGCSSDGDDDWICSKLLRYFIYQIPDLAPYLCLLFALSSLTTMLGSCCELLAFDDNALRSQKEAVVEEDTPLL